MAEAAPSDTVKNKEYKNWLKVTLALYYMKSGLHTFIQSEVNCLHQSLIKKIYGGQTVPLPPCSMCNAELLKQNKITGAWTFKNQCKSYCDVWLHELLTLHVSIKKARIYWDNSDIPSWPFKPWECAKVFMPRGQLPSNVGPADCDAQALMTLLASCIHFRQSLSPIGQGLTQTFDEVYLGLQVLGKRDVISTIRNKVMHAGEMKLSDADRMSYIQEIIKLLEDPVSLKSLEECKSAVGNIQKVTSGAEMVSIYQPYECSYILNILTTAEMSLMEIFYKFCLELLAVEILRISIGLYSIASIFMIRLAPELL